MPGAATDYLETRLLDHALGTTTFTKPTTVYVALFTADPTDTGAFTNEVSATSTAYARQVVTFAAAASGSAASNQTVTFPTCAGTNWGTITHLAITDNATRGSGNVLFYGPVTTSKVIEVGDTFQITSGNLTISLD